MRQNFEYIDTSTSVKSVQKNKLQRLYSISRGGGALKSQLAVVAWPDGWDCLLTKLKTGYAVV